MSSLIILEKTLLLLNTILLNNFVVNYTSGPPEPDFGRSANLISTRANKLWPLHYYCPLRIFRPSYDPVHTLISLINVTSHLPILKNSTLHVYYLEFFHPPLHVYCIYVCTSFFQKIPPSTFSDFATFAPPPRLFQPPRLLERWEYMKVTEIWILGWIWTWIPT